MVTDLLMIVPSRGRPQAVAEMHTALVEAQTTCARVLFVVDPDDPTWPAYGEAVESVNDSWSGAELIGIVQIWRPVEEARIPGVVQPLNFSALHNAGRYRAIGFMGDDHRPRLSVVPWDQAYVAELKRLGTGMVFGNDLLQGPNIPTQIAMTADIIRALGYMAYPGLHHLYADNMWKALGEATGCIRYMPNVIVEHMHPVAGKAQWDENYARVNAPEIDSHDHDAFADYVANHLVSDAAKIRALRMANAPAVA